MIELTPENIVALYKKHDKKPFRGRIFCRKDDSLCCPIGILYFDAHGRFAPCDSEDAKSEYDWFRETYNASCSLFYEGFDGFFNRHTIDPMLELGKATRKLAEQEYGFIPY
jgi:hypothetical protein